MRFWTLALIGVARRPARSALTVVGIGVALGGYVALVGLSDGMERAFADLFLARTTDVVAVRRGVVEFTAAPLDEQTGEVLRRVEGIADVAGELLDLVDIGTGDTVVVAGWREGSYLWRSVTVSAGRLPRAGATDEAVLGRSAAEAAGRHVGDDLEIGNRTFRVTGELATNDVTSAKLVIVPLASLQRALGREGLVTLFDIRLADASGTRQVAAARGRLARVAPDLEFFPTEDLARRSTPLRIFHAVAWGTSLVALVLAVVLVLNTVLMSVVERTREIGVLSAVGWTRRRILALVVLEGVLLAAAGGTVGMLLGTGALAWLASASPLAGFLSPPSFLRAAVRVAVVSVLLGAAGSAYPAWRAVRLDVVDALRSV
jgi:putative ABC transport system permease protein